MRINNDRLRDIIEEELTDALNAKRAAQIKNRLIIKKKQDVKKREDNKETDTERKRRIFNHDDLDKLGRGIVEEDDEIEESNENHDASGQFSSKSNATCKSSYFTDKKRKSVNKSLSDKDDTGRGKNKHKGKGRYVCKNNEPLWQENYRMFCESVMAEKPEEELSVDHEHIELPHDPYEQAKKQQELEVIIKKLRRALKNNKGKDCPLSYEDGLKIVRNLELASKGSSEAEAQAKLIKTRTQT